MAHAAQNRERGGEGKRERETRKGKSEVRDCYIAGEEEEDRASSTAKNYRTG
jgi:hypothetical protein